ncbi:hypothetical protein DFJ74DRAFT_651292 [Hyaloraphidium curvatum]|nr:hypothetical protein DFJ74DRAFT_651292 [Hyaloraphidium curvatum]
MEVPAASGPNNHVCILARAYHAQVPFLQTFLPALSHGSIPIKVFFVITDSRTDVPAFKVAVQSVADGVLGCPNLATVLPVTEADAAAKRAQRKLAWGKGKDNATCEESCLDYGYGATDAAMDALFGELNDRNPHGCGWLAVTNADNLYRTAFLEQLLPWLDGGIRGPADLVGFDFVSRYDHPHWARQLSLHWSQGQDVAGVGPSHVIFSAFAPSGIDLGAALVRVPFLLRQGQKPGRLPSANNPPLRYLSNFQRRWDERFGREDLRKLNMADGHFLHELAQRSRKGFGGVDPAAAANPKRRKVALVRRTLMFHQ